MNKLCKYCGADISNTHHNRIYCSDKCLNKARYERHGERSTPEQRHAWYLSRKEKPGYIEKIREQDRKRYQLVQDFIRAYKLEHGCTDCGYDKHHAALEFDHIYSNKEINVCNSKSIAQAKKEIEKCEVVCSNCHRIRTYTRLQQTCKPDVFEMTYEKVVDSVVMIGSD